MSDVAIGIAGWSYADWRGVVYPRGCKDELRYLARHVDFLEINTTFYRVPEVDTVARWHERTHDLELFFTAKVPGAITHERQLTAEVVEPFRACLEPLHAAGRLRALLAQFSAGFRADPESFELLRGIHAAFEDLAPLVVELRHGSWRQPSAWRAAADAGFSIAQLDYPGAVRGFDGSGAPPERLAYFRIHGRNHDAWFRRDAGRDEVYDYEYSTVERAELGERVRELASLEQSTQTLVVANNHFQGKAVKLALELAADLRDEKVTVPDPLLAAYPGLSKIARGVLF